MFGGGGGLWSNQVQRQRWEITRSVVVGIDRAVVEYTINSFFVAAATK